MSEGGLPAWRRGASTGAPAVLLINPRMERRRNARMPLSLLHLAAVLEAEGRPWKILDGNFIAGLSGAVLRELGARAHALVGVTVMPGPQVAPAIAVSRAIRASFPEVPIVWGGYFPTLYADAAIRAPYVDALVRGQGERPLLDLLSRDVRDATQLEGVRGISFKRDGVVVHNPGAPILSPGDLPPLPYEGLGDVPSFMPPSFLGARTAVYQAAVGCRYSCSFCGVVSMWNGGTKLDGPARMLAAGRVLRDVWGADSIQFFDHNFFDREENALPAVEALEELALPWWCYARSDTLAGFSTATWEKLQRSKLRMVYVGAESGSEAALGQLKKGSRVEHTEETVRRCRAHGIVPELSFMLGGTDDPESEVEATFTFIRRMKAIHPTAEIVLYFYSPTPQRERRSKDRTAARLPVLGAYGPSGPALPTTPEEWTEEKWVRWVCHQDAPWLRERTRRKIHDFARVLACRFPTVQDEREKRWGRSVLRNLARWRYARERYDHPWELALVQRLVRLRKPEAESL
jgi:anaerobic magnesium-protoporphyrin IX monomethyl ester cyclase